jgi:hypothetical protein
MNNITSSARLIKSFQDLLIQVLKVFIAIYLLLVDLLETSPLFRKVVLTLILSIVFMCLFKGFLNLFDYEQVQEMQALHINK